MKLLSRVSLRNESMFKGVARDEVMVKGFAVE